jgi:hypothetical protein
MSGSEPNERGNLRRRLTAWLATGFRPVPVGRWEWFLMRLFFAIVAIPEFWDWHPFAYTTQTGSIGIAKLFDLTWLHQDWVYPTVQAISGIGLLSYVSGYGLAISLPVLTIVHILMRTYENSQGSIHHSHQIVTLVLLVQSVIVLWARWSEWRGRKLFPEDGDLSLRSYLLFHTQAFVAATYVIAALSKAINSKLMWVWNSPYLAFDLVKSHRVTYYTTLDPEFATEPLAAQWVFNHPWIARTAFGGAFFLELLALVALRNRVWAFWTGLALIALHRSIHQVMHIRFERNELVLLIFFVNLPFWHAWMTRKIDGELPARAI